MTTLALNCVFGDQAGGRARRQDQVLEGQRFVAARVQRHVERVGVLEGRPAVVLVDLVLAHQEVDAFDAAIGHHATAIKGRLVIDRDLALDLDAEFLGLGGEDVRQFGVAQQRFRGDAAHVQADTAPVFLLDDGRFQAQLSRAHRRDIAAGPRAQNHDIVLFCHEGNS